MDALDHMLTDPLEPGHGGRIMEDCMLGNTRVSLPEDLLEDPEIFFDVVSASTWNDVLSDSQRQHLLQFLPQFPEDSAEQRERVITDLFGDENFRFGNPLHIAQKLFRDGYFNPEVVQYRQLCIKSQRKRYLHSQQQYYHRLLKQILISRKELLDSARRSGPDLVLKRRYPSSSTRPEEREQRAKRRVAKILREVKEDCGDSALSSDEEDLGSWLPPSPPHTSNLSVSLRVVPSLSTQDMKTTEKPELGDGDLKLMLKRQRERRKRQPDRPDLMTSDLNLNDIMTRVNAGRKGSLVALFDLAVPKKRLKEKEKEEKKKKKMKLIKQEPEDSPELLGVPECPPAPPEPPPAPVLPVVKEEPLEEVKGSPLFVEEIAVSFFSLLEEILHLEGQASSATQESEELSDSIPPTPRVRTDYVEQQRYDQPHKAFTFRMHGFESVVGPVKGVFDKETSLNKAREHSLLRSDRPAYVTILSLVRDAAARLPNGEGTRAEICELLKDSQFLAPEVTSAQHGECDEQECDEQHGECDEQHGECDEQECDEQHGECDEQHGEEQHGECDEQHGECDEQECDEQRRECDEQECDEQHGECDEQDVLLVSPSSMPQLSSVLCTSQPSPLPPHQQPPHQAGMQPAARVVAHSVTSTLPQVRVVSAQAGLTTSPGGQQASLVHQGHQQIRVPVTVAHSKGITQTVVTVPLRTQSSGSPVQVQASRTQTSITVTGLASAVTVTKSSLSSPGSPARTSTPSTVLQSIAGQNIIKQVAITGQLGIKSQAGAGIPLTATNLRIQGKDVLRLPPSSITTDSKGQTVLRITPDMMATLTKSPVTTVKLTPDMLSAAAAAASSGGRPLSATLHVTSSSAAETVSAIKAACSSTSGGATSLVKSEAASIRLMPALSVTMADQKGKTIVAATSTDTKPATTIRIMPGLGVIPQKPGQTITVATAGGKQVPASSGAPVSGAATVTIATGSMGGHKGGTGTPFSLGAGTATMRQVPVSATMVSTAQQGKLPARITVPLSVLSQPLKGKSMVTAPLLKGNIGTNISSLGRNIILTTMPAGTKLIAGNKPVSFVTAQQLQQLQQQGQATQVRIQTVQTQHLQQRTASGSPKPVSTVVVTTAPSPKRTPDPQ
ncbi:UNVERIFIED_CONTAM: hypothetical protein FKN15_020360 [Acipenser sinensis]